MTREITKSFNKSDNLTIKIVDSKDKEYFIDEVSYTVNAKGKVIVLFPVKLSKDIKEPFTIILQGKNPYDVLSEMIINEVTTKSIEENINVHYFVAKNMCTWRAKC